MNIWFFHFFVCDFQGRIIMLHSGMDDLTKQRMLQARALSKEARGGECGCRLDMGEFGIYCNTYIFIYINSHVNAHVNALRCFICCIYNLVLHHGCQTAIDTLNVLNSLQMGSRIVDYLQRLRGVRLNWGVCFATPAHQRHFQIRVLETNQDAAPLAGFSRGWSKTATQGWVAHFDTFHVTGKRDKRSFACLSSHDSIYTGRLPTQPWTTTRTWCSLWHHLGGYFRPSAVPWYNTRRGPKARTLQIPI